MASALRRQQMVAGALVAACLGLGAFYLATSHRTTTKEQDARKGSLLRTFRSDDLTEIVIERDGTKYRLHRTGAAPDAGIEHLWHVEEGGRDGLGDQFAVDKALAALEYGFPLRRVDAGEVNRAQFGLEKPRFRATLTMGKLKTVVALGGPSPKPEGSIYAEVDGEVSVVKKDGLAPVDIPVDGFRTRTVVPYLSTDLETIAVTFSGKTATLAHGPGGSWKLAETGVRVDRFLVDRVLSAFADLKADRFLDGTPAGTDVTIVMTPKEAGKPKGELAIGGECPGHPNEMIVVRKLPTPITVCSGRGAGDALRITPDQLADRRVFQVREDEAEELIIEEGGKKLELARKAGGWHQRAPLDLDVPGELAKGLIKALTGAKGDGPPTPGPTPDPVKSKVTIKPVGDPSGEKPLEVIEVGAPDKEGRVLVRRVSDGHVLRLGRDEARAFGLREAALRSTKVLDVPLDKLRKVTFFREDGEHVLERTDQGLWTIATPKGLPIDLGVANAMAETCLHLTADQWIADHDDGTFGLKKPRLGFEIAYRDGDQTKTKRVELGDPSPIGTYGRLVGEEGVFVVPRGVENQLLAWAIDASQTMIDPTDVTELTITRKGAPPLVLTPIKDGWKTDANLPPSRLSALKDALHDLRADGVVHLGAPKKLDGFDTPALEIRGKRPAGAPERELSITIGAGDSFRGANVFYARRQGVDVVYVIPAGRVRALLGLL